MFKRFFRYLRALIMGKLDQWEDPEVIINESVREMRENQAKNRERAVQAITQKNNLLAMVDQEEKRSRNLEAKAAQALQQGNRELARQILREQAIHDKTLEQLRVSLKQAEETSEAIKEAMRREEERFQIRTAEALTLKANMKQAQIQIAINKALDGLQSDDSSQSFTRAQERIQSMQSEAQARAEVAKTSLQSRMDSLEDSQVDASTDQALAELEGKLGLGAGAPQTVVTQTAAPQAKRDDDIDQQLRELEQKLNRQ